MDDGQIEVTHRGLGYLICCLNADISNINDGVYIVQEEFAFRNRKN